MEKRMTPSQTILVAGTLFGMFFGAGNLIFPVHLGQLAGNQVLPAMLGFIITAVGIPVLGVAAIGITHSDGLMDLAGKVGRGYGKIFTCLLYLTIGPFFAIPRCSTTSFTTGIAPMLPERCPQWAALLIFSLLFFGTVLLLSLKPGKITVWIGKIINPLFLIFLTVLLVTALLHPSISVSQVAPEPGYASGALFSGFIEGYGTMDAIAGLAFGIVVVDILREMGVEGDSAIARSVLLSGLYAGGLMAAVYVAAILMGAQSRGLFPLSENGGIALAQISGHYLGRFGSLVLAATITCACLKTSIGLVTSCADAFSRMFPKSPGYRVWAVLFTVFSFCISNFGLSNILDYSLPVLMFLYPLAITLILLALFGRFFDHDRAVYVCVTLCTGIAALGDFLKALPQSLRPAHVLALFEACLPFFSLNLGWLLPAMLGLFLGLCLHRRKKTSAFSLS